MSYFTSHSTPRDQQDQSALKRVIEEYFVNGLHFTREIRVHLTGESLAQVVAINGETVASEEVWNMRLQQARQAAKELNAEPP